MNKRPLFLALGGFVHGGDYNPEQWLDRPDILEEDIRMMKKAGINEATIGVFSWSMLEPEEGRYDLSWLEKTADRLYENGIYFILATPSGARPAWLDEKYPEARRVNVNGDRELHGVRHNHCMSSPKFRELVRDIDGRLAQKFAHHPGLIAWHISNEFGGECYCDSCKRRFRQYLSDKFGGDIDKLNHAWWNTFWSHRFNGFEQIDPPMSHGEFSSMGLTLEWKRFTTFITNEFMKEEIRTVRSFNPDIPVTANFMTMYEGLDYRVMAKSLDVISWDSYPRFHNDYESFYDTMIYNAFCHAQMRSMKKDRPFLLMESTPSLVNWHEVNRPKRPGVHMLSSLQAVAAGSDSVQYFQWRKGRGSFEQYHGAVVDHIGTDDTRVFKDVEALGKTLVKLAPVAGTVIRTKAAIIYDWDTKWSLSIVKAFSHDTVRYDDICIKWYKMLAKSGVECDIISSEDDMADYSLVIAPQMYMLGEGTASRLRAFVQNGGVLVATYMCGYVDSDQLCWLGGFPGDGLSELFGLRAEEIDAYYPSQTNSVRFSDGGSCTVTDYAEILRDVSADVLARYGDDFYAGTAAVTEKAFGQGRAIYVAARLEESGMERIIDRALSQAGIERKALPENVAYYRRSGDGVNYGFYLNYSDVPVQLPDACTDIISGEKVTQLAPYGVIVITEE